MHELHQFGLYVWQIALYALQHLKARDVDGGNLRQAACKRHVQDLFLLLGFAKTHRNGRAAIAYVRLATHALRHVQMPQGHVIIALKTIGTDVGEAAHIQFAHAIGIECHAALAEQMAHGDDGHIAAQCLLFLLGKV